MKRLFALLIFCSATIGSQANTAPSDPTSESRIEISPAIENNFLNIEVDEGLAGTSVTVSVFSSRGEIVLETTLGIGLNKIDVRNLIEGQYTAVVRENGEYTSKRSFEVS